MIPKFSRVRLLTNGYYNEGARIGMLGYVIETYADGKHEIEFSDASGTTIAQIVADEKDLALAPEN